MKLFKKYKERKIEREKSWKEFERIVFLDIDDEFNIRAETERQIEREEFQKEVDKMKVKIRAEREED